MNCGSEGEISNLAQSLKQEKLFVDSERQQIQSLNERVSIYFGIFGYPNFHVREIISIQQIYSFPHAVLQWHHFYIL